MLLFISFRIFSMCTFNVFKKLFATILIIVKFIRKMFLLHIDTYTIKYHNQTYFYIWKLGFHFPRQNHHLSNKINDALPWLFQGNNFNIIILVNALFTTVCLFGFRNELRCFSNKIQDWAQEKVNTDPSWWPLPGATNRDIWAHFPLLSIKITL